MKKIISVSILLMFCLALPYTSFAQKTTSIIEEEEDSFYHWTRELLLFVAYQNALNESPSICASSAAVASTGVNDPYYNSSGTWGQSYDDMWWLKMINAEQAWDLSKGEGTIVAVIDSGVDWDHPDIAANVVSGWDFYYDDNDPNDGYGHGTHVAGIIAADDNDIGIVGIAPDAKIMPLKIADADGDFTSASKIADAIRYAVNMGARIINCSWGAMGSFSLIAEAIIYAYEKGCFVVAAAHNYNMDVSLFFPANMDETITVSATSPDDGRAYCEPAGSGYYSNYGDEIDVCAPGDDILSLRAEGTDMYEGAWWYTPGDFFVPYGDPDAEYYRSWGTSMAAPIVSGLIALMLSQDSTILFDDVLRRLRFSSVDLGDPGWDQYYGWGRVDAFQALLHDWYDSGIIKTEWLIEPDAGNVIRYDWYETGEVMSRWFDSPDADNVIHYDYYKSGEIMSRWLDSPDVDNVIHYDYYKSGEIMSRWLDSPDADNVIRYEYFESGAIKSRWLDSPDVSGNIRYEYYDEDFYGNQIGRYQKITKTDGSYEVYVEYYEGTDQVKIKEVYDSGENLIVIYEYYISNNLKSITLSQPDEDGNIKYEYYDEDFYGNGVGRVQKAIKADGSYELFVEYWGDTDQVKIKEKVNPSGVVEHYVSFMEGMELMLETITLPNGLEIDVFYATPTIEYYASGNIKEIEISIVGGQNVHYTWCYEFKDEPYYGGTVYGSMGRMVHYSLRSDLYGLQYTYTYHYDGADDSISLKVKRVYTSAYPQREHEQVIEKIEYDAGDNIIRTTTYEYYITGPSPANPMNLKSITLSTPDENGNVKYEYYDESFYPESELEEGIKSQGRVWKITKADGSYELFVEYWTDTDQVKFKEVYDNEDNHICTHEYDENGNLIRTRYEYNIEQLTDSYRYNMWPQINDNGYVVWRWSYSYTWTNIIFLYDGSSAIPLASGRYFNKPKINNNGYVVWSMSGGHGPFHVIYLYDGSSTTVLRTIGVSLSYSQPKINNNGYVVWSEQLEQGYPDQEIFLYDGSSVIQLTDNDYNDIGPQINDNGYVVWQGFDGNDSEIFLYDGFTIHQITDNGRIDKYPQINANGKVIWVGYDGNDWEIFLYDGSTVTQITDNSYDDGCEAGWLPSLQINDNGMIVWEGDGAIFLYDGSSIIQLADGQNPQINANGYVVWQGFDGNDSEIFLYDGFTIHQITDNGRIDEYPQINANGEVVWYNDDIFLATPPPVLTCEYYTSGNLKIKVLSAADEQGNIRYEYYDEDFYGNGVGRVQKAIKADGSYEVFVEYHEGTDQVKVKEVYDNTDTLTTKYEYADDGSIIRITDYEYYPSGNLKSMTLSEPDADGNIKYEYIDEDFYGNQIGRLEKITKEDGSYELFVEYWGDTDRVKIKEVYDSNGNLTAKYQYNEDGSLGREWRYDEFGNPIYYGYTYNRDGGYEYEYAHIWAYTYDGSRIINTVRAFEGIEKRNGIVIYAFSGRSTSNDDYTRTTGIRKEYAGDGTLLREFEYETYTDKRNNSGYSDVTDTYYRTDGTKTVIWNYRRWGEGYNSKRTTTEEYDTHGNIISSTYSATHTRGGDTSEYTTSTTYAYIYDGDIIISKTIHTETTNKQNGVLTHTYTADITEDSNFYRGTFTLNNYDSLGRMVKTKVRVYEHDYNTGESTEDITIITYKYWGDTGQLKLKEVYLNGNLIEKYEYSENGTITREWHYDEHGNPILYIHTYIAGTTEYRAEYRTTYTYSGSEIISSVCTYEATQRINGILDYTFSGETTTTADYTRNSCTRKYYTPDGQKVSHEFSYEYYTDKRDNSRYARYSHIWYTYEGDKVVSRRELFTFRRYENGVIIYSSREEYSDDKDFYRSTRRFDYYNASGKVITTDIYRYEYNYNTGESTFETTRIDYEYYASGNLKSKTLSRADEDGNIKYEYYDEDFDEAGVGRLQKITKEDGSYELFVEYWTDTDQVKIKEVYDNEDNHICTHEYDKNGNLIRTTYEYNIGQITDNSYIDAAPQINANGWIVWQENDDNDWEIFLYDGSSVTQLTDNSYDDYNPQINENGYVLWRGFDGHDSEIFLYDGSSVIQLTDNLYGSKDPQINDNGYVVWDGYDGSDWEIFLYDGSSVTQLTNNSYYDYCPQINDNGYVVWYGFDGTDHEIFLYDGSSVTQLTDNSYNDYDPQINANGYVVWYGYDGSDLEIYLYDGSTIIQLTDNSYYDRYPQINDNGWIVWQENDDNDWEIFLYDGSSVTQLTDNSYDDYDPQINTNGYVVWYGWDGNDYEIFLYDGSSVTQLTDNSYNDYSSEINANGEVVWKGVWKWNNEIFLATPPAVLEYEYYTSGNLKIKVLSAADEEGNIRYEYYDEDFYGNGVGRVQKAIKADGSYEVFVEYHEGTDQVKIKEEYDSAGSLVATYEYDENGNLIGTTEGTTELYTESTIMVDPDGVADMVDIKGKAASRFNDHFIGELADDHQEKGRAVVR